MYPDGQCCFNHILGTMYICLDTFFGIIFSGIHLFDGSSMNNYVNSFTSACKPFQITDITNKET